MELIRFVFYQRTDGPRSQYHLHDHRKHPGSDLYGDDDHDERRKHRGYEDAQEICHRVQILVCTVSQLGVDSVQIDHLEGNGFVYAYAGEEESGIAGCPGSHDPFDAVDQKRCQLPDRFQDQRSDSYHKSCSSDPEYDPDRIEMLHLLLVGYGPQVSLQQPEDDEEPKERSDEAVIVGPDGCIGHQVVSGKGLADIKHRVQDKEQRRYDPPQQLAEDVDKDRKETGKHVTFPYRSPCCSPWPLF